MAVFVPLSQDGPTTPSQLQLRRYCIVGVYQSSCPDQKENISRILMQQLLEV